MKNTHTIIQIRRDEEIILVHSFKWLYKYVTFEFSFSFSFSSLLRRSNMNNSSMKSNDNNSANYTIGEQII